MLKSNSLKEAISQGNYLYLSGDYKNAIRWFEQAISIDSHNAEPYYKIGLIYYQLGQTNKALDYLKRCTRIVRNNSVAQTLYGKLLHESGDTKASLRAYRLALKADKDNTEAMAGMASVFDYNKDYSKAFAIIKPVIESGRVSSQVAILFTRFCSKVGQCKLAIDYANYCLNSEELKDKDVISYIYYSIGDIEENLGNYKMAFKAYQNANAARNLQYNPYNYNNLIETTKSTYNYSYFFKAAKSRNLSKRPVFVVGMPRSGTSLVEQILSSHSKVFGAGELHNMGNILNNITRDCITTNDYTESLLRLSSDNLDHCANEYLEAIDKLDKKASIVIDKMPHNYVRLGFIYQMFPQCKIIHCIRNPIDTCLSIYFTSFNNSHDYSTDFEALVHQYKKYKELMDHWKSVLPLEIHEVSYEELVTDFNKQVRDLVSFCGLEWEEQCLTFYNTKRHVATASQKQISQPLYNTSINRWKNYEDDIQPLIKELKSSNLI